MSGGEWTCEGPDTCCDDLCRGNDYGICGVPSAHVLGLDCGDRDCPWCGDDDYPQDYDDGWSDEFPPRHPLADIFDPGTWDTCGRCCCGAPLPPMSRWVGAIHTWAHVHCRKCGRLYVDEEEFTAIYDDPEHCEDCDGPDPDDEPDIGPPPYTFPALPAPLPPSEDE